jgi:DNA-binding SARP family transcriptional activator
LLGGFDVKVDGTAVPADVWRLSKACSPVKLLALVEGNSRHREAVVEALWPDLGAAAATNNLHQAMHSARRALARRIEIFCDAYGIVVPEDVVGQIAQQQELIMHHCHRLARQGVEPQATWVRQGHLERLRSRIDWSKA